MKFAELEALISRSRSYAVAHDPKNARRRKRKVRLNEPQASDVLVRPMLNWMGWGSPDDPDSLWREFAVPNGQVDWACLLGDVPKVTVECKNIGVNLRDVKVVTQACVYAYQVNAPYAVLTDGLVWAVYRTLINERPLDKLVRKIDIRKCSVEDAYEFFQLWNKATAMAGHIRIVRPVKNAKSQPIAAAAPKQRRTRGKGKPKIEVVRNTRATLSLPVFSRHKTMLEHSLGERLSPLGNNRNSFVTEKSGTRVRFFLSAQKTDSALFNIGQEHLEEGYIFLAHEGCEHGWLLPVSEISQFLIGASSPASDAAPARFMPRVVYSSDRDDMRTQIDGKVLDITKYRHLVKAA